MAGIKVTSYNGNTWSVMPQPGNLTSAQAGFVTNLGSFSSAWNVTSSDKFSLEFSTPKSTEGLLGVPTFLDQGWSNVEFKIFDVATEKEVDISGLSMESDKHFTVVRTLKGGSYKVEASYS